MLLSYWVIAATTVLLSEAQRWPGFRAVSLMVFRVVQLAALRAVAPVQIPALAHPALLEVAQAVLRVELQAEPPDPRHGSTRKEVVMP